MFQFLETIDKPVTGTVYTKYPEEFINGGYPKKVAAQFKSNGWSGVRYRTRDEYILMGEYPGRNAGLFASNLPAPVIVPKGYQPPLSVLEPRPPRRARFAVGTD
jgi:hypothetical protein